MQISSRFTAAVHILTLINTDNGHAKTSDVIAESVNTNPVVIRRIEAMLKKAGLITICRGEKGAKLAIPSNQITLLDVYRAVSPLEQDGLFKFHESPNPVCEVGANIHGAVTATLDNAQKAMEQVLQGMTIEDVTHTIHDKILNQ